jgi:hypothetical protein
MDDRKVIISGINNRYQIKKLTKNNNNSEPKNRKITEKMDNEVFLLEKQTKMIDNLFNGYNIEDDDKCMENIIYSEILKKISSYKQQDAARKIFDQTKFIDKATILRKLYECKSECYYCKIKMLILYEKVREMKQWTVDRINNDLGHNNDNIVSEDDAGKIFVGGLSWDATSDR